jgi:hypothetical protein
MSWFNFLKRSAWQLSTRHALLVGFGAVLCVIFAIIWQGAQQYHAAEAVFENHITKLLEQQAGEAKRAETLLNALSQFYASDRIKSNEAYEQFAQGLVDKTEHIEAIGLAQRLTKSQAMAFETEQQNLGFEAFKVELKGLFLQETHNPTEHQLAIYLLAPFIPEHSIYLGQDLLGLPNVQSKLAHAIEHNRFFSDIVQLTVSHRRRHCSTR